MLAISCGMVSVNSKGQFFAQFFLYLCLLFVLDVFESCCKGKLENLIIIDQIFTGIDFPYLCVHGGVEVDI